MNLVKFCQIISHYMFIITLLLACNSAISKEPKKEKNTVEFEWDVKVPMRDGIKLSGTLYKSQSKSGLNKLPTIFVLTPYASHYSHDMAYFFAQSGYHVIVVDTRGRGNSEGNFTPMLPDAKDGFDVIEWVIKQPWSDGRLAMWGGSYLGYTQWATLKEGHPSLKTIVPTASVYAGMDFPIENNIAYPYIIRWLSFTSGKTLNIPLFGNEKHWHKVYGEYYNKGLAFSDLPQLAGVASTPFNIWSKNPEVNAYWESFSPSQEDYTNMDIPILTITGHYDGDQEGAMRYYHNHKQYAPKKKSDKHYLIMGPWNHSGTRRPKTEMAGVTVGAASLLDIKKLHIDWYDWVFKGKEKPEFLKNKVAYFVVGTNKWQYSDSLENIQAKKESFYLGANQVVKGTFQSGQLNESPQEGLTNSTYIYDPRNLHYKINDDEKSQKNYYLDQSIALDIDNDGLVFHTKPFAEDSSIIGQPKLTLWISIDVPDTDFHVSLYEIKKSGESVLLTDTMMRARYRESLKKTNQTDKNTVYPYEFDLFKYIGRKIKKDSRIRLVVKSHNYLYQTNYNGGGDVYTESIADAKVATVKVYHSSKYPSVLELPIEAVTEN